MRRYQSESLEPGCRIAVVANDALGNYAIATLPLQMLRARWQPFELALYCGSRIAELASAEKGLFDRFVPLHGNPIEVSVADKNRYDLVLNLESTPMSKVMAGLLVGESGFVCGPCVGHGGRGDLPYANDDRGRLWEDKAWARESLSSDYPFLKTGFIGEIFCRLCYLEGEVPNYQIASAPPPADLPPILIAMSASLESKIWTTPAWIETIESAQKLGFEVGLIGAKPRDQKQFWFGLDSENALVEANLVCDLRGTMTLPQVVGALAQAKLVLTLDNGIMHFAIAGGAPTIGLFRHGIHWLWAPPATQLHVVKTEPGATVATIPSQEVTQIMSAVLENG